MDTSDHLFISNAGLVIIHPYLPTLFERLNLFENKTFKDEESRAYAVCLLEYLVRGETTIEEPNLALNKLFCGWPMTSALASLPKLSEDDKKLGDSLLEAVIQNWNALGDITINGFRESFLVREALLSQKSEEWQLKVEQKAFDILLTQLPWTISSVLLPWMNKRVSVEWK